MRMPFILTVFTIVLAMTSATFTSAREDAPRTPVVVELFTSEGCSSCPRADVLLGELAREQPVDGAQVIALAYHVDYWDYLGWKDPFASKAFTDRQREYAAALKQDRVYTPQMIVDGRDGFVGSERTRAKRAIAAAARATKARVEVVVSPVEGKPDELTVRVALPDARGVSGDVMLALTEDGLETRVARGENAGRKLKHDAVVRELRRVGSIDGATRSFEASESLRLDPSWDRTRLRVVAFVQESTTRRVVAAGVTPAEK